MKSMYLIAVRATEQIDIICVIYPMMAMALRLPINQEQTTIIHQNLVYGVPMLE
jgi:hypothetical protein